MSEPEVNKKRRKPMSLMDKLTMNPIEKYVKFNEFPLKLFIHIIVLLLSTAQILLIVNYTGAYARSAQRVWMRNFFDEEIEFGGLDYDFHKYIYDMQDLKDIVSNSVGNYYSIATEDSTTMEKYDYFMEIDEETGKEFIKPPRLSAYFIRGNGRDFFKDKLTFDLTEDNLGPFDEASDIPFQEFLSNVTNIIIEYEIKS